MIRKLMFAAAATMLLVGTAQAKYLFDFETGMGCGTAAGYAEYNTAMWNDSPILIPADTSLPALDKAAWTGQAGPYLYVDNTGAGNPGNAMWVRTVNPNVSTSVAAPLPALASAMAGGWDQGLWTLGAFRGEGYGIPMIGVDNTGTVEMDVMYDPAVQYDIPGSAESGWAGATGRNTFQIGMGGGTNGTFTGTDVTNMVTMTNTWQHVAIALTVIENAQINNSGSGVDFAGADGVYIDGGCMGNNGWGILNVGVLPGPWGASMLIDNFQITGLAEVAEWSLF